MASLFKYLGGVNYRGVYAPNILKRLSFPASLITDATLFHKYVIIDGDRPDTIAYHYYGSSVYDWVVHLSNQSMDLYSDWPLRQEELDAVVVKAYGSIEAASAQISHYRINGDRESINEATYNALPATLKQYWSRVSNTIPLYYSMQPNNINITPTSYTNLPDEEKSYWEPISHYDRAFQENEDKRAIRLIDASALPSIERTLRALSVDQ